MWAITCNYVKILGVNSSKKQLPFVRNVFRAIQVDYENKKYNICSLASSTPRPLFPFLKTGFYRKKPFQPN